jgi:hypothetical protein
MTKRVGPSMAFDNRKLVYTVHIYTFSFWWSANDNFVAKVLTPVSLLLSVVFLLGSAIGLCTLGPKGRAERHSAYRAYDMLEMPPTCDKCYYALSPRRNTSAVTQTESDTLKTLPVTAAFLSMSIIFHAGWLALAIFYYSTATTAGCSSFAADSVWLIALTSALVLCTAHLVVYYCYRFTPFLVVSFSALWIGIFFLSVFAVGSYLSSDTAYFDSLKAWSLNDRPVPVWVGEVGTGDPNESAFKLLWQFIREKYDLDFAYWAFNGRKFGQNGWESESFGLMDDQYSGWRFPRWNVFSN